MEHVADLTLQERLELESAAARDGVSFSFHDFIPRFDVLSGRG